MYAVWAIALLAAVGALAAAVWVWTHREPRDPYQIFREDKPSRIVTDPHPSELKSVDAEYGVERLSFEDYAVRVDAGIEAMKKAHDEFRSTS